MVFLTAIFCISHFISTALKCDPIILAASIHAGGLFGQEFAVMLSDWLIHSLALTPILCQKVGLCLSSNLRILPDTRDLGS